ncbi:hypothetical protein GA0115255_116964 [Streptomyces sp. Ncost-T6T-2b]|nr:hypothetical protein GA0115255_116964 [Streptomyces sp. Ncost-T6T-2b]
MPSFKAAEVRMTLRVSHDSGRTWGPLTEVCVGDNPVLPDNLGGFPPCACRQCMGRKPIDRLRMVS